MLGIPVVPLFPLYSLEKNETEMVMAKKQIRDKVIGLKHDGIGSEKLYLSTTPLTGRMDK